MVAALVPNFQMHVSCVFAGLAGPEGHGRGWQAQVPDM